MMKSGDKRRCLMNSIQITSTIWVWITIIPTIHSLSLPYNSLSRMHQPSIPKIAPLHPPQRTQCILNSQSNLNDYLEEYLSPGSRKDSSYSHMIGIPLEECRDLMLELESVQRAVLYHCPLLADACLVPAVTRMPLMYINATTPASSATERHRATQVISDIVEEVIHDKVFVKTSELLTNEYEREGGANRDGIRPLMMNFQGLELDGSQNEVLHAVGMEGAGTRLLRDAIGSIRERLHQCGYGTVLPPDNPQGKECDGEWRPRVPFMRLPSDFVRTLPPLSDEDDDDDRQFRSPEEGGNGISPIFFYKWWDDSFTTGDGVRLRQIATYARTAPKGLTEHAFYIPHKIATLPQGNHILTDAEARDKAYADSRSDPTSSEQNFRPDIHSTTPKRKPGEPVVRYVNPVRFHELNNAPDRTRRISLKTYKPGQKTPATDYPVQKTTKTTTTTTTTDVAMPAYPSDPHFVGVWRLVSSPAGSKEGGVHNAAENLILRVDHTVAGGPVLDREYNQKPAGGTWKLFDAAWVGEGESPVQARQTRLRIRLVIPPKKEQYLVMEGEVTRVVMPRGSQLLNMNVQEQQQDEGFLHCGGEVWVEDIEDEGNRKKLGKFTAMKLKTPDQRRLRYLVPPPRRGVQ